MLMSMRFERAPDQGPLIDDPRVVVRPICLRSVYSVLLVLFIHQKHSRPRCQVERLSQDADEPALTAGGLS